MPGFVLYITLFMFPTMRLQAKCKAFFGGQGVGGIVLIPGGASVNEQLVVVGIYLLD